MKTRSVLMVSFLSLFVSLAVAAPGDPSVMLKTVSKELTKALAASKPRLRKHRHISENIIKRIVLPHMDVQSMARSALGRNSWRKATSKERRDYMRYFNAMLVRTYAESLSTYSDERVTFYPVRGGYKGRSFVQVYSTIARKPASPLRVTYNMWLRSGRWKVYDFSVNGVSMVQSYRSQFASQVAKGGMKRLIKTLAHRSGHFNYVP